MKVRSRPRRATWTTRDGKQVRVCDMGDAHLLNTIRYLDRYLASMKVSAPYPDLRGEMAQYYAESEWETLQGTEPGDHWPIFNDMVEEASERGLKILPLFEDLLGAQISY